MKFAVSYFYCISQSCTRSVLFILNFTILLIFLSPYSFAQFDHLLFKKIDVEVGLSQNTTTNVFLDSYGFVWIGTDDGLNRYDGYDFKIYRNDSKDKYSLTANWIVQVFEDNSKNLWVLTYQGLNKYDRTNDRFISYLHKKEDLNSLPSNHLQRGFVDSKGGLWFSTLNGFCKYINNSNSFERFGNNNETYRYDSVFVYFTEDLSRKLWVASRYGLASIDIETKDYKYYPILMDPKSMVVALACDLDNEIWVCGLLEGEIYKYDYLKDKFLPFMKELKNNKSIYDSYSKIFVGKDGIVWYLNPKGLIKFDKKYNRQKEYSGIDAPKMSNDITMVGDLLYITSNYGLYTFDTKTEKFKKYIKDEYDPYSLVENQLISFHFDKFGGIWIRTNRGGISKIADIPFKPIRGKNTKLNSKKIYSVYQDRNENIWFTTLQDGLNMLNSKTGEIEHFNHSDKDPHSIQSGFLNMIYQEKNGTYWIGSRDKGISTFDFETRKFTRFLATNSGLEENATRSFLEDSKGDFWIGTRGGGLHKLDRKTNSFGQIIYDTVNTMVNQVITIFEDSEYNFWLGTDAGLILYDRETGKQTILRFYFSPNSPLGANSIFHIVEDENKNLWLTTYGGGIIRFNHKTKESKIYSEADGLINNYVYNITIDDSGYYWLNTHKGLSRFDKRTGKFINFTSKDGIPSNELNSEGALRAKNGLFIFGSANGAFYFNPLKVVIPETYKPILTAFKKYNQEVQIYPDISVTESIELNYSDNYFSIEFSAGEFDLPERVKYAYKLEGFDKSWNFVGNKREATYTNLDPGEYWFNVIASNGIGKWDYNGKRVKIVIHPEWWQTLWYKIALAFLIGGVFLFIYRYRINNIRKIEEAKRDEQRKSFIAIEETRKKEEEKRIASERRLKETISQNLHDGVLSEFASIPIKCSLLLSDKRVSGEKQNILSKISNIASSGNQIIRDEIWFLDYRNETNDYFNKKFTSFIGNILEYINYTIDITDDAFDNPFFTMNIKQHIFLIYKEVLHNILKHSKAKNVQVNINREGDILTMSIIDDGVGFDISQKSTGNGLCNIQKRSIQINGEVLINSAPGKGTSLTIIVRLANNHSA